MAQKSPTIADILEWVSHLKPAKKVNAALATIVPKLMQDPTPVYADRIELFQILKSKFPNAVGKPIVSSSVYQSLPFPIAYTLKQANEHSYSNLVQLLFLFDAVEISIRWLIAVYVAVIIHENKGVLPSRLANSINGPIKRATFGKWIGILREVSGYVKDKRYWCITKKSLPLSGNDIDTIISERNNVAHGNTAGELKAELKSVVDATINLFKRVKALHLNNILVAWNGKGTDFIGDVLSFPSTTTEPNGMYIRYQEALLELPVLFFLKEAVTEDKQVLSVPYVLGFVSTKAKLEKVNEEKSLDYVELNGTKVDHVFDESIIQQFITTFQTNNKISSDHPWQEEIDQASEVKATAWEFERLLIKHWKKERESVASDEQPHILWFGGKSDIGRTTLLQGALHPLKQEKNGGC